MNANHNPRRYWQAYVAQCGGIRATSERLRTPISTIYAISNGQRGIGRRLAHRFAKADPMLDADRLIWVRPTGVA